MTFNPDSASGVVCFLFIALASMLGMLECRHGFGPAAAQHVAMAEEAENEDDRNRAS
ncbi:hypothetical protein Pan44_41470 [Caulifigura coniformis]|uniref:Uncharacterized protein n=1 Tax=Caulifigura coniformis TaxID=2527983 RepID=A0A517SIZ6_9PLAN|nr:hypothetical protein [Caulifigura coniformis]QDT56097.1 hypothetical protein Pan44_41470 [Caulifigura coniformis]